MVMPMPEPQTQAAVAAEVLTAAQARMAGRVWYLFDIKAIKLQLAEPLQLLVGIPTINLHHQAHTLRGKHGTFCKSCRRNS
jgi:hypothetical protein